MACRLTMEIFFIPNAAFALLDEQTNFLSVVDMLQFTLKKEVLII